MKFWYVASLIGGCPIEGRAQYSLPNMECPKCGMTGGLSMVRIPFFNPHDQPDVEIKRMWRKVAQSRGEVFWDDFHRLVDALTSVIVRNDVVVAPSVSFGLSEAVVDVSVDYAAASDGIILLKRSALDLLERDGIKLEHYAVKARFCRGVEESEYVELFAPIVATAHESVHARICDICMRAYSDWIPCPFDSASVPNGTHLFRIRECPNAVIGTETLVSRLRRLDGRQHFWRQMEALGSKVHAI